MKNLLNKTKWAIFPLAICILVTGYIIMFKEDFPVNSDYLISLIFMLAVDLSLLGFISLMLLKKDE